MDKELVEMLAKNIEPYINKPIALRHHYSGVWLGYLRGVSPFGPHMLQIEGRRVWSWSGGRLEFSELCEKGVAGEDRLGTWTVQHIPIFPGDGLVELTTQITDEVIQEVEKWSKRNG